MSDYGRAKYIYDFVQFSIGSLQALHSKALMASILFTYMYSIAVMLSRLGNSYLPNEKYARGIGVLAPSQIPQICINIFSPLYSLFDISEKIWWCPRT